MPTVTIQGWDPGFQKVQFTFLSQREFGCSLREAKSRTDAVMEARAVELTIPDDAQNLLESLRELGARFELPVPAGR